MRLLKVQPSTSELSAKTRLYYHCAACGCTGREVYADLDARPGTYYCTECATETKEN